MNPSTYEVLCLCGHLIRTPAPCYLYPCGRRIEIQWPSDYKPKPTRNGELPTL